MTVSAVTFRSFWSLIFTTRESHATCDLTLSDLDLHAQVTHVTKTDIRITKLYQFLVWFKVSPQRFLSFLSRNNEIVTKSTTLPHNNRYPKALCKSNCLNEAGVSINRIIKYPCSSVVLKCRECWVCYSFEDSKELREQENTNQNESLQMFFIQVNSRSFEVDFPPWYFAKKKRILV